MSEGDRLATAVPPQFRTASRRCAHRVHIYPYAVTGTPVASYGRPCRTAFSARLMGCIRPPSPLPARSNRRLS